MFRGWVLLGLVLACLALGCGSERDRGKNKNADRPSSDVKDRP